MLDACAQLRLRRRDVVQRLRDLDHQLQKVVRAAVGQLALGERPDVLVGIDLRRVGREVLDMESRMTPSQLTQGIALVGRGVVEDHDHVPGQVSQQQAQELADLELPDVGQMQAVEEAQVLAPRAHRNTGDDRDLVPPVAMAVDRRATARRPGAKHRGNQEEARFIDEDDVGAQPCGVFFTRGHSRRFHLRIAASSRSRARRSGF